MPPVIEPASIPPMENSLFLNRWERGVQIKNKLVILPVITDRSGIMAWVKRTSSGKSRIFHRTGGIGVITLGQPVFVSNPFFENKFSKLQAVSIVAVGEPQPAKGPGFLTTPFPGNPALWIPTRFAGMFKRMPRQNLVEGPL